MLQRRLGVARLLDDDQAETAGAEAAAEPNSPWAARDGFQLGGTRSVIVPILIDGHSADAAVSYGKDGMSVIVDGATPAADAKVFEAEGEAYVLRRGRQTRVRLKDMSAATAEAECRRRRAQGADARQSFAAFRRCRRRGRRWSTS